MRIFYEFENFVKLIYDQSGKFFYKGLTNYLDGASKGYMFEPTFDAGKAQLVLALARSVHPLRALKTSHRFG